MIKIIIKSVFKVNPNTLFELVSVNGNMVNYGGRRIYAELDPNNSNLIKELRYSCHNKDIKSVNDTYKYDCICNNWVITVNAKKFKISNASFYKNYELIFQHEGSNVFESSYQPHNKWQVGKYYRLRNGTKMKLIADCGIEFSETRYVGIYDHSTGSATVRFDQNGKITSHAGDKNYEIIEEWKEDELWVVVYYSNMDYKTVATITSQSITKTREYENKFKDKGTYIKTQKIELPKK
jgi:hypothetical protein